jgi:transcriptional regulator with GAF, ATPase, and Fis domain
VLEEGEVYRLGENKPRKVNFRLIAATNRDLRKEIQAGRFRMDLVLPGGGHQHQHSFPA